MLRGNTKSVSGRFGGPINGSAFWAAFIVTDKHHSLMRMACGVLLALALAACGASADHPASQTTPSPATYTIGGTVSGLAAGATVVLANNGSDPLTVAANGAFTFAVPESANGSYAVTIVTQPIGETCSVSNATGAGVAANVASLKVVCSSIPFSVGGTVTGLNAGAQLKLANNGADVLAVTGDGAFAFPTPVPYNGGYNITVATQPVGEICSVSGFSGTGVTANITTVRVTCSTATFSVNGTLTSLAAGMHVTLDDNGADALTLNANGAFTFATAVPFNGSYDVTIGTQPVGQICSVTNGSGSAVTSNIAGINVSCSTDTFTIGGTLTGLDAGTQVTLTDNGGDALTLSTNGAFTFAMPIAFNGSYNVVVGTPAVGQNCTVSNGSATPVTTDVSSIGVSCVEKPEFVYVANEIGNTISQYSVGADGSLTPLNPASVSGASLSGPVSLAADPTGRFVYVANMGNSTLAQYTVAADGTLTNPVMGIPALGTETGFIAADPLGRFAAVVNATSNSVALFALDNGALVPSGTLAVTTGLAEPLSIAFDPLGRFAYVDNAANNTISPFSIGGDGTFTPLSGLPTAAGNDPATLVIEPSGHFLYAANALDSTISAFAIATDGGLTPLAAPPVATGREPVAMAITPSGQFIYTANAFDLTVSQFSVGADGTLTSLGNVSPFVGNTPDAITVDPFGRYVYVANFGGASVSPYVIGPDGRLTSLGFQIPAGAGPTSILIVRP